MLCELEHRSPPRNPAENVAGEDSKVMLLNPGGAQLPTTDQKELLCPLTFAGATE
jgi:hypothetical protein